MAAGKSRSRFAVLLVACLSSSAPGDDLATRLQPLIDAHQGQVAVAIKHLGSAATYAHRGDVPMPTASLIKFPIMVAAYQAIADGRASADAVITLKEADKVPGSGILTSHFSAGATLSLRDAIRLMIAFSDNTATNLVIEQVGLGTTADLMDHIGLPETKLHSQVYRRETSLFPDRSEKFGLGSTTAAEMVVLLEKLQTDQLVNPAACAAMREHLAACDDKSKFRRFLPHAKLAHKTGAVNAVRTDAGLLDTPAGVIALCVLTAENKDQSWGDENAAEVLCGRIAEAVYQHFNPDSDATASPTIGPLRIGAQGLLVEGLQRTLNARSQPSPELGVDGDFGPATAAAVIAFQAARGLEANGVVGPETWAALGPMVEIDDSVDEAADDLPLVKAAADPLEGTPFVTCKAWGVMDGTSGELIGGELPDVSLPNASTTKMMTAYLVIRFVNVHPEVLDERIEFSPRADQTIGSTAAIRTGESIAVRDLLYGLLLPSGNDAAVALAEHFGTRLAVANAPMSGDPAIDSDAYNQFVAAMNAAAMELGLTGTKYENPHGLQSEEHAATPRDLLRLARAALAFPLFQEIVNSARYECLVTGPGGYRRSVRWTNTNRLLAIEGYDGVKTGTTTLAGACLVSRGHRDGRTLLVAVLGSASSESRYTDTRNLFRWGWQQMLQGSK